MFTQAPGTKNALFLKIFCRLNISWTYFHCWRPDLWSPAVVMMLWFDFINIFRIHNQLKCHMILFLGKDMLAPVPSMIVMTDNLSACDWWGQITWPAHCSLIGQGRSRDLNTALIMTCPLWSAEAAIRGHYHDQAPDPGASNPGENILLKYYGLQLSNKACNVGPFLKPK